MKDTIEPDPQQKCQKRERKQIRQMKRKDLSASIADGSDIQSNQRRKDFGKPGF